MTDRDPLAALLAGHDPWFEPSRPPRWTGHPLRHRRRNRPVTYRVRLDLLDTKPPIWRRLDLVSNLALDELHVIIQVAMGWTDSHLHTFAVGGRPFSPSAFRFLNPYEAAEGERGTPEHSVALDETVHAPGDRLWYTYDFGDGWDHALKLEQVRPRRPSDPAFVCVGGRRACPPEDCGGVYGYEELLAYREDPEGAPEQLTERAEYFLPEEFDPAAFDVDEVNEAFDDIRA